MRKYLPTMRRVAAYHTINPVRISEIITSSAEIHVPEKILKETADLIMTVLANRAIIPQSNNDYVLADASSIAAAYVLRYALLLNRGGLLVEAPPPAKRENKKKIIPEEQAIIEN